MTAHCKSATLPNPRDLTLNKKVTYRRRLSPNPNKKSTTTKNAHWKMLSTVTSLNHKSVQFMIFHTTVTHDQDNCDYYQDQEN